LQFSLAKARSDFVPAESLQPRKSIAIFDGEALSILDENKLVGELVFQNLLVPSTITLSPFRRTAKGAKDASWLLLQRLDERKRVYIDQQIPSVSSLNIYCEQKTRVETAKLEALRSCKRLYRRNAVEISFCSRRFI